MCYLMIGSECEKGVTQPVFGLLQDVLHRENSPESDIIFVCQPKRTVLFCTHFAAYQIECIPNAYQCFFVSSLKCHYLFNSVPIDHHNYVKSKYDLTGYF